MGDGSGLVILSALSALVVKKYSLNDADAVIDGEISMSGNNNENNYSIKEKINLNCC